VDNEWSATTWKQRFGDADQTWIDVPADAVLQRSYNPTGGSIICYSLTANSVYCFIPWIPGG
jgi:hypothetical protein